MGHPVWAPPTAKPVTTRSSASPATRRSLANGREPPNCSGRFPHVGLHTLRHAFITAALDAGVPLRDVQEAASHAVTRTTMRYVRARTSLDRHATYIVATYIAGALR